MKLLVTILCVMVICTCRAQLKGFSIGPYLETAWPTGDFNVTHRNGIGGGLSADVRLGKLGLTGSAGALYFHGKNVQAEGVSHRTESITAIPVRIGLKYRPVPLFYLKLEGGTANYTNGNQNAFILSPGIGLRLLGLDVQFKYENWMADETRSMWGLKAGYNF